MSSPVDIEARERELEELVRQAVEAAEQAETPAAVEEVRVKALGRKGGVTFQFDLLKGNELGHQDKARFGQALNNARRRIEEKLEERRKAMSGFPARSLVASDASLPGYFTEAGRIHPITQTIAQILEIFRTLGFSPVDGPELETEHNNFDALNISPEHPSRDRFDTFYIAKDPPLKSEDGTPLLLRTHTSPVQIRFMKGHKPPFQIVVPGRVFRRDEVDPSHCFQFHQVEGLAVGPGVTFGDLKGVLSVWAHGMFGEAARLRFRPHYFPFTEPSAEADLACIFCDSKGCRVCGHKGWLEILGCGMVHPNVFKAVGFPAATTGFAFGVGVERIAMLKYGIEDIRFFFENDMRFLKQFP